MKAFEKLQNGSVVLASKQDGSGHIVLALVAWKDEYATWSVDETGNAFHGHYFDDLIQAVEDFKKR